MLQAIGEGVDLLEHYREEITDAEHTPSLSFQIMQNIG
ncbi:unnamed protein product, partial [marine sediment metagenome]